MKSKKILFFFPLRHGQPQVKDTHFCEHTQKIYLTKLVFYRWNKEVDNKKLYYFI